MRIALLVSGQLRGFPHAVKDTWGWLLEQVTDTYYFCSAPGPDEPRVTDLIPGAMGVYCNDKEEWGALAKSSGDPRAAKSMGSQFYKLQQCCRLMHRDDYDLVVRCRPDLAFSDRVDFSTTDPAYIWVPRRASWGGYCDQFAVGSVKNMRAYCDFIDRINDWVCSPDFKRDEVWKGNPETRLYHDKVVGPLIRRFDMNFYRMLANGGKTGHLPGDAGWYGFDGQSFGVPEVI